MTYVEPNRGNDGREAGKRELWPRGNTKLVESPRIPCLPFERAANLRRPEVIESYCSACGLFVAASPSAETLELAESTHICHESRRFQIPESKRSNRPRHESACSQPHPRKLPALCVRLKRT